MGYYIGGASATEARQQGETKMTNIKQLDRDELRALGTVEALNEILLRNARMARAREVMRKLNQ